MKKRKMLLLVGLLLGAIILVANYVYAQEQETITISGNGEINGGYTHHVITTNETFTPEHGIKIGNHPICVSNFLHLHQGEWNVYLHLDTSSIELLPFDDTVCVVHGDTELSCDTIGYNESYPDGLETAPPIDLFNGVLTADNFSEDNGEGGFRGCFYDVTLNFVPAVNKN